MLCEWWSVCSRLKLCFLELSGIFPLICYVRGGLNSCMWNLEMERAECRVKKDQTSGEITLGVKGEALLSLANAGHITAQTRPNTGVWGPGGSLSLGGPR